MSYLDTMVNSTLKLGETCHNRNSHGFRKAIVLVKEANTRLCADCLSVVLANGVKGTTYTIEVI